MNQEIFLRQLESLLADIPEDERREAMEYYRCYFEDAGEENEESVLNELGSPEQVAQTIKADLAGEIKDGGFTEKGYEEFSEKDVPGTKEQIYEDEQKAEQQSASYSEPYDYQEYHQEHTKDKKKYGAISTPLRIIAIVCMSIAVVVVVAAVIAVAVGLVAAVIAIAASGFGCFGVTVASFLSGAPAVGLGSLCGGFMLLAVFFLLLLATVAFCAKALPAAIRGICNAASKVCGIGKGRKR